ncbi:MAG: NTP transferase domain-containing protein [Parachlamydiales bacterium]|nr:NTP transferase domain-containing protein [Parachlamydiales bacterium]
MKVIILAGGEGRRLWPLSSAFLPKQFIPLEKGISYFQKTVLRFRDLVSKEQDILIVTKEKYLDLAREQIEKISMKDIRIIGEKYSKNTAYAIALGVKYWETNGVAKEPILVSPSDHAISPEFLFKETVLQAIRRFDPQTFMLFGIRARHYNPQYGYIRVEQNSVIGFLEKPVQEPHLLEKETLYINAGITVFQKDFFVSEVQKFFPELFSLFGQSLERMIQESQSLLNSSFDKAVLEKTKSLEMIPLAEGILWRDIGSWESLLSSRRKKEEFLCCKK